MHGGLFLYINSIPDLRFIPTLQNEGLHYSVHSTICFNCTVLELLNIYTCVERKAEGGERKA